MTRIDALSPRDRTHLHVIGPVKFFHGYRAHPQELATIRSSPKRSPRAAAASARGQRIARALGLRLCGAPIPTTAACDDDWLDIQVKA